MDGRREMGSGIEGVEAGDTLKRLLRGDVSGRYAAGARHPAPREDTGGWGGGGIGEGGRVGGGRRGRLGQTY